MSLPAISDQEFIQFQTLFFKLVGIHLAPTKKMLVSGRLAKRLRHYGLNSYHAYFQLVTDKKYTNELQIMVDLLTTNETHFFREVTHFDYLRQHILPPWQHKRMNRRAWSAACSSGEEAYSLAMTFMEILSDTTPWEIVATDVNIQMLEIARAGRYPIAHARHLPQQCLNQYCLKGVRSQEGILLIDKKIRDRVHFRQVNLHQALPTMGQFDLIFLRNTLIYFDTQTKQQIIKRILPLLKPDGHFVIGHAESLLGVTDKLYSVIPTLYKKRDF
jgi:chemotaxis protein methyltransferase CheR